MSVEEWGRTKDAPLYRLLLSLAGKIREQICFFPLFAGNGNTQLFQMLIHGLCPLFHWMRRKELSNISFKSGRGECGDTFTHADNRVVWILAVSSLPNAVS